MMVVEKQIPSNGRMLFRSLVQLLILCAFLASCQEEPPSSYPAESLVNRPLKNVQTIEVPEIGADLKDRLYAYQQARFATAAGWIGKKLLIRTRFGNTSQLHLVDEPLGARTQITFTEEPVGAVRVPPVHEPTGFIYSQDMGGTETYQLYWHDLESGSRKPLTEGNSRNIGVVWNQEGTEFAYTTNQRDGTSWDIHAQDLEGRTRVLWQRDEVGWTLRDWAPDGKRVLITKYISSVSSLLYEVDLETGESAQLVPAEGIAAIDAAFYAKDGQSIYFTSDLDSEFINLFQMELQSQAIQPLIDRSLWDIESIAISPQRDRMAIVTNQDGYGVLSILELGDFTFLPTPNLPAGLISSLVYSRDGRQLAITLQTPTSPPDAYVLHIKPTSLTQWTQSELGPLKSTALVTPELIRYQTFDDREIPAFVYRPNGVGPHPVFISIHGGPASQYRPRLNTDAQFLVGELGLAVIGPNVRGSSGYGKTWLQLDDKQLREDSVKDIGALLDWIRGQPDLDPERVVVYGGSYGGYMVLASMVHFNDRLAAGIEIVGISNFVTFLENTRGYRRDLRRSEYGDERELPMREFLESIAPLHQVDRITRPMLIGQGLNDPRVPVSESKQIVKALISRGLPVWYVLAENEGHGFAKKDNRDYWDQVVATFLMQHLNLKMTPGR